MGADPNEIEREVRVDAAQVYGAVARAGNSGERRGQAPEILFVSRLANPVKPLGGTRDKKARET